MTTRTWRDVFEILFLLIMSVRLKYCLIPLSLLMSHSMPRSIAVDYADFLTDMIGW